MGKSSKYWDEIERIKYEAKLFKNNRSEAIEQTFLEKVKAPVSTGYSGLDQLLDGGLASGQLIILGGAPGLGKTGLALTIMENIAKSKQDVFVFSLEMSENELIARSISRQSFLIEEERGNDPHSTAISHTTLLNNKRILYRSDNLKRFREALTSYCDQIGKYLPIFEGDSFHSIEQIEESVAKHVAITGVAPVVLVDYLQVISNSKPDLTRRERITESALRLKSLARKYNTTVIAISSINRNSYDKAIDMSSFKESGEIEYISDVLLGLQINNPNPRYKEFKDLELSVIKNRTGSLGRIYLRGDMRFNQFIEI